MNATHDRPYDPDRDFDRVRAFLISTYTRDPAPINWFLERWDYNRYFCTLFVGPGTRQWEADIHLWETARGELAAVAHHEGQRGEVYIQIHRDYKHLQAEIVLWAETHLSVTRDDGKQTLTVWTYDHDKSRQTLLRSLAYRPKDDVGHRYRRDLSLPLPDALLADGYRIRPLRETDIDERCEVMGRAFGSTPVQTDVYRSLQTAPGYRPNFDLVVTAPDGSIAAFTLMWYDEANQIGMFEPVGAHPAHQRKGLAKALMAEGLRRLIALGATHAFVGTGTAVPANKLYQSLGFAIQGVDRAWVRTW